MLCVCVCVLTASSQHRDQHIPLQLEQHKCQSLLFLGLFESLLWQLWLLRLQMVSETRVNLDPQNKFMNSQLPSPEPSNTEPAPCLAQSGRGRPAGTARCAQPSAHNQM